MRSPGTTNDPLAFLVITAKGLVEEQIYPVIEPAVELKPQPAPLPRRGAPRPSHSHVQPALRLVG